MIFYNARIHTCDPENPLAEAMEVVDGTITAIGSADELIKNRNVEALTDLKGKSIIPGFFDAHAHYWKIGDLLTFNLDLRDAKSIADIQELLKDFSVRNPHLKWIRARGFNESLMKENRLPVKEDIDAVVSDKPVFLQRTCAHIAVLNTRALEVCGIDADTKPPFGGEIRKGADGTPDGVLSETALGLATKYFPQITSEDYEKMILAAGEQFLKNGVTSVADPAVMPDLLEVYKKMDREGKLPLRLHAFPIVIPDGDTKSLPIPERYESDMLVINTVKFFADGGLSGQTAAVSRRYKNRDGKGVLRLERNSFFELALKAQKKGFRIATHAIGDVAIDLVLDVYEKLYEADPKAPRHRIEHFGLATDKQMERAQKMGLHIVTQPIFLYELGANFRMSLDDAYLKDCYRFKTMLDQGLQVSFSTDAPVVKSLNPFLGLKVAADRKDAIGIAITPEESVDVQHSLSCYTLGSARACGVAQKLGSLEKGKCADFVILDRSPFDVDVQELPEIKIDSVWLNGMSVYSPGE